VPAPLVNTTEPTYDITDVPLVLWSDTASSIVPLQAKLHSGMDYQYRHPPQWHEHSRGETAQDDSGGPLGRDVVGWAQLRLSSNDSAAVHGNNILTDLGSTIPLDEHSHSVSTGDAWRVDFRSLLGAPSTYLAQKNKVLAVKEDELGLEFRESSSGGAGVTDHGALTGLLDNDHTQYLLSSNAHSTNIGITSSFAIPLDKHSHSISTGDAWRVNFNNLLGIPTASAILPGIVELAIASEVASGNDATRAITPDSFAGSDYGIRMVEIIVVDGGTALPTAGDGKAYFHVPAQLNGMNLVTAHAGVVTVSNGGTAVNVDLYNVTDSTDMLSTNITIDNTEFTSYTAATPPVINTSYDDVVTGDIIRIDLDQIGANCKGLNVILGFAPP
jgi:hypothetical protein